MKIHHFMALLGIAQSANFDDRVEYLDGMGPFNTYALYSGYLKAGNSRKHLHYVLAESQKNPSLDPLVVWFNGGPGCSSMLGFLQEHGPYVMEDGETQFHKNDYSWNRETNMLYIESPAGVGYSVCEELNDCKSDDYLSSDDNLQALLAFFAKFPEYQQNDLYLSGESYAGIYVPFLAWRIDNYNFKNSQSRILLSGEPELIKSQNTHINLKGLIIGNGVTDWRWDGDPSYVKMGLYFSLYGMSFKDKLQSLNCTYDFLNVDYDDISSGCMALYWEFLSLTRCVNIYDVYRKPEQCDDSPSNILLSDAFGASIVEGQVKTYKKYFTSDQYTPWLKMNDKRLSQNSEESNGTHILKIPYADWINQVTILFIFDSCSVYQFIREQLNIPKDVQAWEECSESLQYSMQVNASIWIYPILKNKYRILHYSGTTDGAVPTGGTKQWINSLGWDVQEVQRPYFVEGMQLGGMIEVRDGLTFATIHGTGHMAPQWKRSETYYLVFNWLFERSI